MQRIELLKELSEHIAGSWILECGWRLVGIGHSRLWLRIDECGNGAPVDWSDLHWGNVRIDIKCTHGRYESGGVTTLCGPFDDAKDAAKQVKEFCESWEE